MLIFAFQQDHRYYHFTSMKLGEHNASTSVYLEQMTNHIEVGEGYQQLRKLLFRELNKATQEEGASEDSLADSIVSFLAEMLNKTVNFHRSQQTFRILQMVEDLLTYADETMTAAMHTQLFVSALVNVATPKIITFDSKLDMACRGRALAVFAYWFNRFGRDESSNNELFIRGYKQVKEMKLLFPSEGLIKPNDLFKKELEKERNAQKVEVQSNFNTNQIILDDIEDFTIKTESLLKDNFRAVATTEYVRLIKHKSKTLFEFTSKPNDFKQKEKNLVKELYKRLRVVLKELDKYKQSTLQSKKSEEAEKQYMEAKITPKKLPQKEQSPAESKPSFDPFSEEVKIQPGTLLLKTPKKSQTIDLLEITPAVSKPSSQKLQKTPSSNKTNKATQQVTTVDLLNDNLPNADKNEEQQEFVEGTFVNPADAAKNEEVAVLFQVFSTPKKEIHEEDGVFLAKQDSNRSQQLSPAFQNEKKNKNPYSFIPDNLDLTPTSSIEDDEEKVKEKPGFSFFGLLNFGTQGSSTEQGIFEAGSRHYDSAHKKGKKCSEEASSVEVQFAPIDLPAESKDIVFLPTYKPVEAVNYEIYAKPLSSSSQVEEEQSKFELTPKKASQPDLNELQFIKNKSGQKIKLSEE